MSTIRAGKLLINEPPLTVSPSLATLIGLNEAIALQQLHYWLGNKNAGVERDGYKWIFNTMEEWQEGNFPFWSTKTIARTWSSLASFGLVVIKQFDQKDRNMRNYYRIDYDALDKLDEDKLSSSKRTVSPPARPQRVPLLKGNTETTYPEIKEEDDRFAKIKTSLLLANISRAIDPIEHGTITIQDYMRKLKPAFVIGWLAKTCHDKGLPSPIGYLTNRLKGTEEPDQFYMKEYAKFIPTPFLEAVGLSDYKCPECEQHFTKLDEMDKHIEKDHPIIDDDNEDQATDSITFQQDESVLKPLHGAGTMNMAQAWESVLSSLKLEMPAMLFNKVADTVPVQYIEWDDVLKVGAHDTETAEWLESRIASSAQRLLIGVANIPDIKIEFVEFDSFEVYP